MKPFRMQNRYVLCVRMIVQARAVLVLKETLGQAFTGLSAIAENRVTSLNS